MGRFTATIPSFPHTLVARAERLAILAHALDAFDPMPAPGLAPPPPMPRQPASDGNENRFYTVLEANRELYNAEYVAFLQQTRDFKAELDEWAMGVINDAKKLAGTPPQAPDAPAMGRPAPQQRSPQEKPADG